MLNSKTVQFTVSEDPEVAAKSSAVQTPLSRWKGALCFYSVLSR